VPTTLQLSKRWQSQLTLPGLSGTIRRYTRPYFAIGEHFRLDGGHGRQVTLIPS